MTSHVVILGCGRSGTSIFGELFEHIPGYEYLSEPEFDAVLELDFTHPVAIKVPKESDPFPASPGLSFPLPVMLAALPEPRRFYWQVRHPLDAIASLRVGISNNWGHHPRPPDWQDWADRSLVSRCAHHWAHINTVGYEQVKAHVRVCRFESMLSNPSEFARQVCAEIGVRPWECRPGLDAWSQRVQDSNNENFVEAKTSRSYSRADHSIRVGRWRENLSVDDLREAIPIVREAADTFGYTLPGGPFEA